MNIKPETVYKVVTEYDNWDNEIVKNGKTFFIKEAKDQHCFSEDELKELLIDAWNAGVDTGSQHPEAQNFQEFLTSLYIK